MAKAQILIVENDLITAWHVEKRLQGAGYAVAATATSGQAAIEKTAETQPDLVLMDIGLEGTMNGIESAAQIRARFDIPVVFMTAHSDTGTLQRAQVTEPYGYILKPLDERDLRITVEMALHSHEMKKALQESEEKLRTIFAASPDCTYLTDVEGIILDANPALLELVGLTLEEIRERNILSFFAGDDPESLLEAAARLRAGEEVRGLEAQARTATGAVRDYEIHAIPLGEKGITTEILGVARDITQRKQAEERVQASLRDKETLLQEVLHRVKNNLNLICSLLDLQADSVQDPQARQAFQDCRHRIRSMALMHEGLYRTPDMAHIDAAAYVQVLTDNLLGAYAGWGGDITLSVQTEDVTLDVDTAIPCGQIISELVSNALKHAFPPEWETQPGRPADEERQVLVALNSAGDLYTLVVSDNGVGLSPDLDPQKAETLGLQLVTLLVEQLQGTVEIDRSSGTQFKITFPAPPS